MDRYDLCVLGGGPSGYAAAMRAVDFGKKVLLIEKDKLGGAGIYDGALSSKTFWEISKEYESFHEPRDQKQSLFIHFQEWMGETDLEECGSG